MPDLSNLTVLNMLRARMTMLGERQKVLSENVANVSTPGYRPSDIDTKAFGAALEKAVGATPAGMPLSGSGGRVGLAVTHAGHMTGPQASAGLVEARPGPDSETTLDGNAVVVEDQMMKVAETRMDFEAMVGLYQKTLSLMRLAARSPTN